MGSLRGCCRRDGVDVVVEDGSGVELVRGVIWEDILHDPSPNELIASYAGKRQDQSQCAFARC